VSKQLRPLWTSEDERASQMKENAHCPRPEKLSSLAFFLGLSMNSLFVCAPASGPVLQGSEGQCWAGPGPNRNLPESCWFWVLDVEGRGGARVGSTVISSLPLICKGDICCRKCMLRHYGSGS
jgi:hypothetical protein